MRSLSLLVLAALAAMHAPPMMMNTAVAAAEESAPAAQEASVEPDRVAAARAGRSAADLRARFARAGVPYPPAAIFLRAFKHERELELWALPAMGGGDATRRGFRWVHTYPLQAASGALGPKRQEGDSQVPEGVYRIDRFNPWSRFHLSLGLNYPNASDLARTTNPAAPGSDVFLHGGAQSDGCLAMGDPAIEELYLVALDTGGPGGKGAIPVHLFPCRMTPANWREVLTAPAAQRPELDTFWRELQPIFDAFERERIPPAVSAGTAGVYRLE